MVLKREKHWNKSSLEFRGIDMDENSKVISPVFKHK